MKVSIRQNDIFTGFLFLLLFTSFFHFPILTIGNDSIGIFDLMIILMIMIMIVNFVYHQKFIIGNWKYIIFWYYTYAVYLFIRIDLSDITNYKLLLIAKMIENIFLIVIYAYFYENGFCRKKVLISLFKISLFLLAGFQISQFLRGEEYRVGLPFTIGVSSNPAGFILGVSVIIFFEDFLKKQKTFSNIVLFLFLITSFLLTFSRTNFLGIFVAYAIYYTIRAFKTFKRLTLFSLTVVILFLLVLWLSNFIMTVDSGPLHQFQRFAILISDPLKAFKINSFRMRFDYYWPKAIKNWLYSYSSFFLGQGTGYMTIVDGTIPRLLGNQGIIGFFLFIILWFVLFIKIFPINTLRIVLLFVFFNSINAETLIVSYRAIQAYISIIMILIFYNSSKYGVNHNENIGNRRSRVHWLSSSK